MYPITEASGKQLLYTALCQSGGNVIISTLSRVQNVYVAVFAWPSIGGYLLYQMQCHLCVLQKKTALSMHV